VQVRYGEGLATHTDPGSCDGNATEVAARHQVTIEVPYRYFPNLCSNSRRVRWYARISAASQGRYHGREMVIRGVRRSYWRDSTRGGRLHVGWLGNWRQCGGDGAEAVPICCRRVLTPICIRDSGPMQMLR
jgi:hypothetical protein